MKKYGFGPGATGWHIGKLNKAGDMFIDKELVSDSEILAIFSRIVVDLANKLGKKNPIVISSNGETEFEIHFPDLPHNQK